MHLLLEVTAGPSAGKTIRLQPGQSIRIGRTDASEFPIPADTHISGRHFEIELTHHDCRIRDLRSTNGTLLNGQKIDQALLSNGDTISAGQTTIRVTITADVAAPVAPAEPGPLLDADATPQQRLLALFRTQFQPLFTILDSARDIKILALLMQSKEEHQSLYEGVEGAKLAQVAPYLVRLNKDSLLLGSLVLEGWGNSWGVFLTCDREFQDVRRHLRHFLEVQLPDGKQVYFRYYDPRVLRVFLPTCNRRRDQPILRAHSVLSGRGRQSRDLAALRQPGQRSRQQDHRLDASGAASGQAAPRGPNSTPNHGLPAEGHHRSEHLAQKGRLAEYLSTQNRCL